MSGQQTVPEWQQAIIDRYYCPSDAEKHLPEDAVAQTVSQRFELMAERYPDGLALQDGEIAFTYQQLNEAANSIAHAILAESPHDGEAIGLLFETEAALVVAMLGAMKAGIPFVLFDPEDPPARIEWILKSVQVMLVITTERLHSTCSMFPPSGCRIVTLETLNEKSYPIAASFATRKSQTAYINFTSGSTGRPKGVVTPQQTIVEHSDRWNRQFHVARQDRFSLFRPALRLIFGALLGGASLHIWDYKRKGVSGLVEWLAQQSITVFYSGSTSLRHFLNSLRDPIALPALRLVLQSGEPLYRTDLDLYRRAFAPVPLLANLLMCREVGLIRCFFLTPGTSFRGEVVPVGYAVTGAEVSLIGEGGNRLPFGEIGEIAVQSDTVAGGYWQEKELTAERFMHLSQEERIYLTGDLGRMEPDGCLYLVGRKDFQLKIRGYRVEIGEVEGIMRRLGVAHDLVVVGRENQTGEQRLIAYLALHGHPQPSISFLRQVLSQHLPNYLIPSAFVFVDTLPLNVNGRLDRQMLPLPGSQRPVLVVAFAPPATPFEQIITDIWQDILGLDEIGIHDPFLELGGNSLQAMRIAARVQDEFGVEIPLAELFAAGTVAEMALVVTAQLVIEDAPAETGLVSDRFAGIIGSSARKENHHYE